jgi:hypothetical protein
MFIFASVSSIVNLFDKTQKLSKMKKSLLFIVLFSAANYCFGQYQVCEEENHEEVLKRSAKFKDCDTKVQRLDSLSGFLYNGTILDTSPSYVVLYYYNGLSQNTSSLTLSLPDRINSSRQSYKYDQNGNLIEYLYQEWKNDSWLDVRLWQYIFDNNNHLVQEYHLAMDGLGNWYPFERQFYNYENGLVSDYIRQSKNNANEWYDVAHHYYIYNTLGQLIKLYGQYISNNIVFWERTLLYNDKGQCTERFLKVNRYNSVLKKNELVNNVHNIFSYDIFGDITQAENESWYNESWIPASRQIYYYSFLPHKKVSVCHNGHQICISAEAVKAHLEHGDYLGSCDDSESKVRHGERADNKRGIEEGCQAKFMIYPNPASDNITISFTERRSEYMRGYLLTTGGKILRSFNVNGTGDVTINISGLIDGTYFIRLEGKDQSDTQVLIKK